MVFRIAAAGALAVGVFFSGSRFPTPVKNDDYDVLGTYRSRRQQYYSLCSKPDMVLCPFGHSRHCHGLFLCLIIVLTVEWRLNRTCSKRTDQAGYTMLEVI